MHPCNTFVASFWKFSKGLLVPEYSQGSIAVWVVSLSPDQDPMSPSYWFSLLGCFQSLNLIHHKWDWPDDLGVLGPAPMELSWGTAGEKQLSGESLPLSHCLAQYFFHGSCGIKPLGWCWDTDLRRLSLISDSGPRIITCTDWKIKAH